METVVLQKNIKKIPERAFFYCSNLTSMSILGKITKTEDSAFYKCMNLKEIIYESSEEEWKKVIFESGYGSSGLKEAKITFKK